MAPREMAPILRRTTGNVNGKRRRHSPLIPRPQKNLLASLTPQLSRHRNLQTAQRKPHKHRPTQGT